MSGGALKVSSVRIDSESSVDVAIHSGSANAELTSYERSPHIKHLDVKSLNHTPVRCESDFTGRGVKIYPGSQGLNGYTSYVNFELGDVSDMQGPLTLGVLLRFNEDWPPLDFDANLETWDSGMQPQVNFYSFDQQGVKTVLGNSNFRQGFRNQDRLYLVEANTSDWDRLEMRVQVAANVGSRLTEDYPDASIEILDAVLSEGGRNQLARRHWA